ncbi:hypothetical protein BKI52_14440 [marine bacterium AO1-C]|nr:hypothetical protein BKI52_14440 [marine bacterium AO1-C]
MDTLQSIVMNGEIFYKIPDAHLMRPFFMSIVSDSNHWLFVSSNGGISAGRKNPELSLFPYYTDDKITDTAEVTGSKTILRVQKNGKKVLWEPFSIRSEGSFEITRNLYQNRFGNKVIFEEINHDIGLGFQYEWNTSNLYGFVKQSKLVNLSDETLEIAFVDGLQNLMPYGVPSDLQTRTSNLADAYKRSELVPETGLALFALSAIIVDKAEPSEALKTNIAWSLGLQNPVYLLSSLQLQQFRKGNNIAQEADIKGEKGAYFVASNCTLEAGKDAHWMIVANVNQTQSAVVALNEQIKNDEQFADKVLQNIEEGTARLTELNASADALQYTADDLKDARHFSNVLFNIMRGGIFDDNYQIEKQDFEVYLKKANKSVFEAAQNSLSQLPEAFSAFELKNIAQQSANPDFIRLAIEYLPLKFSRRHGDPSRPWNQFSINTNNEIDGSKILDYQGNWRDIFQNWEALVHSYPGFIEGMIYRFLNASTFDGYNPYRVTKDGFDWETIEPDNPWSYIGYWGDHQIIYLLKFLEFAEQQKSGTIKNLLSKNDFVYANVPYEIKPYSDIVKNPKDTIVFADDNEAQIQKRIKAIGADGALLVNKANEIHRVNFAEKILATLLSKLSNFIPEGGIWMNTQRPEWNDANNALVGNGVSMVTLYYLRRFLKFFQAILQNAEAQEIEVSSELQTLFEQMSAIFAKYVSVLAISLNDATRKKITDELGNAASLYRNQVYQRGFSGQKQAISTEDLSGFITTALEFLEHSINANKREDHLYHAYNLMSYEENGIKVTHLSEMLEGQVAVLSAGYLSAKESLQVLDALRSSALYRPDQNSYILYPNKNLPGFLQRNNIPKDLFEQSALLTNLLAHGNPAIAEKDVKGNYHFNGSFKNANDLSEALGELDAQYQSLVNDDKALVLSVFEEVFNHKEFTGRSGTFYGYEGLGSIYWHMVSKLLLAVKETCLQAIAQEADKETIQQLVTHYYQINDGIGVHKSPELYGAFPITPYSHTPSDKGAQQPGMTGQVKEDILSRFGELGVFAKDGKLHFQPQILRKEEFLSEEKTVDFFDVNGKKQEIKIPKNALLFTKCKVPVIYEIADEEGIEVFNGQLTPKEYKQSFLNEEDSANMFKRNGKISLIKVKVNDEKLI